MAVATPDGAQCWDDSDVYATGRETRRRSSIFTNYREAAKKAGFQPLFTCREEQCFLDQKPSNNVGNCERSVGWFPQAGSNYLAAKLARKDGDVYLAIHTQKRRTDLHYVTVKAMVTGLVLVDAAALKAGIQAEGHVAVYGIVFDTDKANLEKESLPAIAEIVKLLKADPKLSIHVVGHTDSVGNLAKNMALSRKRAEAIVDELVKKQGIDKKRLRPEGVGPLCPVATNASDEGRARNRRVDLVQQ